MEWVSIGLCILCSIIWIVASRLYIVVFRVHHVVVLFPHEVPSWREIHFITLDVVDIVYCIAPRESTWFFIPHTHTHTVCVCVGHITTKQAISIPFQRRKYHSSPVNLISHLHNSRYKNLPSTYDFYTCGVEHYKNASTFSTFPFTSLYVMCMKSMQYMLCMCNVYRLYFQYQTSNNSQKSFPAILILSTTKNSHVYTNAPLAVMTFLYIEIHPNYIPYSFSFTLTDTESLLILSLKIISESPNYSKSCNLL